MSDSSDHMEFSPTKVEQVSACEKLRDTVTGISALHKSIQGMDGRSPSPRNSFKDLYLSSTQAMIRRKEEMVSELKILPPCTRSDCQDHKIPSTSVEEEINFEPSPPENKIETVSKPNKKKLCKKPRGPQAFTSVVKDEDLYIYIYSNSLEIEQDIGGIAEVLFLQRLPTHVQQILAISNDQLDKQAEMADRIMAVANPTPSVHVIDAEKQDLQTMLVEISSRLSRLETRE
ncbi:hypothetical protein TNCV_2432601 [Trichonephila clavipes]|nr:hypothetical protein TNCV_2432601 [Trichonephila clavipes]